MLSALFALAKYLMRGRYRMNILRFLIPKSLVEYVEDGSTVRQAYEKMSYHRYTAIPVLDGEGRYIGTLRNDDLFEYFKKQGTIDFRGAEKSGVMEIVSEGYAKPLLHSADMTDLVEKVKEHNFVPVVDDRGCFIGLILRRDVLNFLFEHYQKIQLTGGKQNG